MTDQPRGTNEPLIARGQAPDHGPNFWTDLEASFGETTSVMEAVDAPDRDTEHNLDQTSQLPRDPADRPWAKLESRWVSRNTATDPGQSAVFPKGHGEVVSLPSQSPRSRRVWPMAAAAALLAFVGLGFLATRGSNDPLTTTEVVGGPTVEAEAAALDGPDDDADASAAVDESTDPVETGEGPTAPTPSAQASPVPVRTPGTAVDPAPTAVPALLTFEPAHGAGDATQFPPLDQGLPADATFLATWTQRQVSWYGVTDPTTDCTDAAHAEIRFVNGSGITQPVRDPQLRFSGEISHFTLQEAQSRAAWVVSCGTQLELYVATLLPSGEIGDPDLVWLGEGSVAGALMLWDANEVSFNSIEPGGSAFAIDYNVDTRLPSRNGGPSRILIEAGAPADRSLVPLAASPDGSLTYWAGQATIGSRSACPERFGTGIADTLWLRQGEGQWVHAVPEDTPLGSVTALAIEPGLSQIAFADLCPGSSGRLFLGTQRADGLLSNLREVDLAPYVPGFVEQLFWVDAETLRIETNNTEYGFGTVRFDFRFDDGNNNGIIVQLD